jgi:hypothetical protein
MATPLFAVGYVCKATIQPAGAGSATDINITGWDWEPKINAMLTTHSGSEGIAQRLAGVLDGAGQIMFNYDLANPQNLTPYAIVAGGIGVIALHVSGDSFFQVPYMIESTPYKVVVDGKVEVSAKILLNGAAGTYIEPV